MNIYDFFNSPDVAKHCKSIGHVFNGPECAVFIMQSEKRTLKEKHAAYRAIIREFPDTEVPAEEYNRTSVTSLHQALKTIIDFDERNLERLLKPEPGAVYEAQLCYKDHFYRSFQDELLFGTYEEAMAHAREITNDENECYKNPLYMGISKNLLGRPEGFAAYLTPDGKIQEVTATCPVTPEHLAAWYESPHREAKALVSSFYFDVPVPFKTGDIVEILTAPGRNKCEAGVYILKDLCRDDPKKHKRLTQYGDLNDMAATGYCVSKNRYGDSAAMVEAKTIRFYPDLLHCRRELEGDEQILKYISLYMQGIIDLPSLLKIQTHYQLDKKLRSLKKDSALERALSLNLDNRLPY